jgi:haloalkane dehalogenase
MICSMSVLASVRDRVLGGLAALTAAAVDARGGPPAPAALPAPAARFENLPDWPYETRFVRVDPAGYRMAYVDEGPRDGPVAWLQHGNPAWGYYYRHAIGPLAAAGFRVVVPDLVGFGRSDKPAGRAVHTYANHERWLLTFLDELGLREVNAHLHDWGGLLGLRLVAFHPDRFARVLASNTSLPLGGDGTAPPLFRIWQVGAQLLPSFGRVIAQQSSRPLPASARAAYDAPFPDRRSSLAPRQLPLRVPLRRDDEGAARNRDAFAALASFREPFLTAFSDPDDITTGADRMLQDQVPGAAGRVHPTFAGTRHYLMEDAPEELTRVMIEFFSA